MPHDLQIVTTLNPGYTLVQLVGEARLDVDQAEVELEHILQKRPKNIIIDASKLSFCSSLGMKLLLNLQHETFDNGGSIKLAGLQPLVKTSFAHARILERFELFDTLEAALPK